MPAVDEEEQMEEEVSVVIKVEAIHLEIDDS